MTGRLVFLLSAPRSGSSMLQRVIAADQAVYSDVESYVMFQVFPPGDFGMLAETVDAASDHLGRHSAGRPQLVAEARRCMTDHIYDTILDRQGAKYFLDKTPAYTRIADRIVSLYPDARYIVLLRNPLALLQSGLSTWLKGDHEKLYWLEYDLIGSLRDLSDLLDRQCDNGNLLTLHYEEFVSDLPSGIRSINEHLALSLDPDQASYRVDASRINTGENQFYGDPKSLHLHSSPTAEYVDNWKKLALDPQTLSFALGYLDTLGPTLLKQLGYDGAQLRSTLLEEAQRAGVGIDDLRYPIDFEIAITPPKDRTIGQRHAVNRCRYQSRYGRIGSLMYQSSRIVHRLRNG